MRPQPERISARPAPGSAIARTTGDRVTVILSGSWAIAGGLFDTAAIADLLDRHEPCSGLGFAADGIGAWDSSLIEAVIRIERLARERDIPVDRSGLPSGVQILVALADAVPEHRQAPPVLLGSMERLGLWALGAWRSCASLAGFIAEVGTAMMQLATGRSRMRRVDFLLMVQECGPAALPIVSLISILVGVIIAFVGAAQLEKFGAQIYIANLVGIAMVREMGAMMTAIIIAGRTGAAFAANLGAMEIGDEISALRTLGIKPVEFLVLPRLLALILMLPLLTVFADIVGIFGGLVLASVAVDIHWQEYVNQTRAAVTMADAGLGLAKALVFGAIVAVIGCWRGMHVQRSAAAVGDAATSAVVLSIVLIVVADAIFTVAANLLGI